jgi:hypothetical protein
MTQDPTICPEWIPTQYRREAFRAIVRSVKVANQAGPNRWGLSLYEHSLRLKVGPHEVLQIIDQPWAKSEMPVHLIVDKDLIPSYLRPRADLLFSGDWDCYGTPGAIGYYLSNPGTEACDFEFSVLKETYDALYDAHVAVIRRAAGLRLNPATRRNHSSSFVSFLASETGHSLAQPAWMTIHEKQEGM